MAKVPRATTPSDIDERIKKAVQLQDKQWRARLQARIKHARSTAKLVPMPKLEFEDKHKLPDKERLKAAFMAARELYDRPDAKNLPYYSPRPRSTLYGSCGPPRGPVYDSGGVAVNNTSLGAFVWTTHNPKGGDLELGFENGLAGGWAQMTAWCGVSLDSRDDSGVLTVTARFLTNGWYTEWAWGWEMYDTAYLTLSILDENQNVVAQSSSGLFDWWSPIGYVNNWLPTNLQTVLSASASQPERSVFTAVAASHLYWQPIPPTALWPQAGLQTDIWTHVTDFQACME